MNNVAELIHFVYKLLEENEFRASSKFWFDHVLQCLNLAANQVLRDTAKYEIYRSTSDQNLVAGTAVYSWPDDILDRQVHSVWWYNQSRWEQLEGSTPQELELQSDQWRSEDNAYPTDWLIDPESNKLRIHPPPNASGTNYLKTVYVPKHPHLFRFWGTPVNVAYTIGVTKGSAAATLLVSASDDVFQSGDYIGIITPKPSDTTAIAERTARRFFKATTVSGTAVTLDSVWDGATDGTAYFVTGQNVAILERYESLALPMAAYTAEMLAEIAAEKSVMERMAGMYQARLAEAVKTLNVPPVGLDYEEIV